METKTSSKRFYYVLACVFIAYILHSISNGVIDFAWPNLRSDLVLPDACLGYISSVVALFTILTCVFSNKLFPKISSEKFVLIAIILQFVSLVGTAFSKSFPMLLLFSVPMGIGSGALEKELNEYSSKHFSARSINYLHLCHCFGGVGGPFLMSLALKNNGTWQKGYFFFIVTEIIIGLFVIISLPQWQKLDRNTISQKKEKHSVSFRELFSVKKLKLWLIMIVLLCALEYIFTTWTCTFLVDAKHLSESAAAGQCIWIIAGMACGRFVSGLLSEKIGTWNRIYLSFGIIIIGIALFLLPLPSVCTLIAMFVLGLGLGPIYSNLLILTPSTFGEELSETVIDAEIAASYFGFMLMALIFGNLYSIFGTVVYDFSLVVLTILSIVFLCFVHPLNRKTY